MTEWISIVALEAAALPGLPGSERGIRKLAFREGWDLQPGKSRKGEAGAIEYHVSLLPKVARGKLAFLSATYVPTSKDSERSKLLWQRYEMLTTEQKEICKKRLDILVEIDALKAAGARTHEISRAIQHLHGFSKSAWYEWRQAVSGLPRADWLAALAPSYSPIVNGIVPETKDCHPDAWKHLCSDFLRPGEPKFSPCYRRMVEEAQKAGWRPIPGERTLRRRMDAEYPQAVQVLARRGPEAARHMMPQQRRDKSNLHAMQMVNTDGHVLDLRVTAPWSKEPVRIILLGIQDLYSGKILSYRLCQSETWEAVRSAIGDMVETYGIPDHIFMDNGKAFASKKISGQAKSRNRFKIKDDEIAGVLTALGVEVHFTKPYRGQSKPIERAWKDLAEEISLHPTMDGAYTGNNPTAKPFNYGSRAVDLADLQKLVQNRIAEHNARLGRRSQVAKGRSFDQAFEESYEANSQLIRTPTSDQRSLWLLAAHELTARKPDGRIEYLGNRYWARELNQWIGKKVTFRFDPDRLHDPIKVYDPKGRLICDAPCIEDVGFATMSAARSRMREEKEFLNAGKAYLAARDLLSPRDLGALTLGKEPASSKPPRTVVTRLATRSAAAAAVAIPDAMSDEEFSQGFSNALSRISGSASILDFPSKTRGKK